jgi:hypothetical protein
MIVPGGLVGAEEHDLTLKPGIELLIIRVGDHPRLVGIAGLRHRVRRRHGQGCEQDESHREQETKQHLSDPNTKMLRRPTQNAPATLTQYSIKPTYPLFARPCNCPVSDAPVRDEVMIQHCGDLASLCLRIRMRFD